MKPWIKRIVLGFAGITLVVGGLTACGVSRYHGTGSMSEADATAWRAKQIERVADRLDLDAAQKAKLAALGEMMALQRKALRGNADNPRAEFQALIAGPKFDRTAAQNLVQQKTDAIRAGSPQVIAAMGDFYDSLRPEQQQKVRDFMQKQKRFRRM
ncbi:MAG: Spy/CpxP family protein refolding chaperone [Brachymonas denitrificans]|jgi:Spy/CpxP family protein refolding chaperone|uniref:Spy/CpxP family protein refolding chaperone n=1 Tax=Brachymonas denitrificans TaxID=28220 RepID=UPI001BCB7EA3|nr:Spy/CpxP family protein refolding chaperone [Brachymonas denitrificans]